MEAATNEEADRSILVGPQGPWIAVYDEDTEEQNEEKLDRLAKHLSTTLDSSAITVLVHDSDVLLLGLFENGRILERFDSNPEFSGRKRRRKISALEWTRFLIPGRTQQELEAALYEEKLFAENTLGRIAELLGMDVAQVGTGYRYILAEKKDVAQYQVLRFRAKVRPQESVSEGPPQLLFKRSPLKIDVFIGTPFREHFGVHNVGGASKGLHIIAEGEALSGKLIALREAELMVGLPSRPTLPANFDIGDLAAALTASRTTLPAVPFQERDTKDGKKVWMASFPDVPIPAGVPIQTLHALATTNVHRRIELQERSSIHVGIKGDGLAPGTCDLKVTFVPIEAPKSGHNITVCPVQVHHTNRRPLRASADVYPHLLQMLEEKAVLFAIASCPADIRDAAGIAASLIEKWGDCSPRDGKYWISVISFDPEAKSKESNVKTKGFFQSARWKELKVELASAFAVKADCRDPNAAYNFMLRNPPLGTKPVGPKQLFRGDGGFTFGRSLHALYSQLSVGASQEDPECLTLALWLNVQRRPQENVRAARELLIEIVDEWMTRSQGLQGLIGEWQSSPSIESTAYERVCGIHGKVTSRRSWLTRFLRGVTDDWIWLGEDLLCHLDQNGLAAVAEVVKVGTGIRVRLRSGSSLHDLESALANVLPSESDWQSTVYRLYGSVERIFGGGTG